MNTIHLRTSATVALAVAAVAMLGACSKKGEYGSDTTARHDSAAGAMADTTHKDTLTHADSTHMTSGGWTPASIVGYAATADTGEIILGRLAEKKATNPAVKAFGREMVTDHTAMLKGDRELGKKLNATWDSTTANVGDVLNHTRDEVKDLTEKAKGADWDGDYIDKMIDDHQAVLGKLQDAAKNTTDKDAESALEKATAKVQEHLTKAQDIKNNKLNKKS
jgi:putative membrane protein